SGPLHSPARMRDDRTRPVRHEGVVRATVRVSFGQAMVETFRCPGCGASLVATGPDSGCPACGTRTEPEPGVARTSAPPEAARPARRAPPRWSLPPRAPAGRTAGVGPAGGGPTSRDRPGRPPRPQETPTTPHAAAAPPRPEPPSRLGSFADYELVREVARGGM